MSTKKTVQTCGKLYWVGEYAVLYPKQGAIIKNIPIYMTATIETAEHYQLASDMFDYSVGLEPDASYALIQETVLVMNNFLASQGLSSRAFSLSISGKMEKEGKKIGLGSSGSVVILTLKAMAALYELDLSSEQLFKLASYVLLKRGDNGSMGDVACIAYEDLIYYQAFDRQAIKKMIEAMSLEQVLAADWGYVIRRITPSLSFDFLVGWTKEPAISKDMIKLVQAAINPAFLAATQEQVLLLEQALTVGDKVAIKASLNKVGSLLADLSPAIYNEKLKQLRSASSGLDSVAKSSGAGGGDCGIALAFDQQAREIIKQRWQEAGIDLLYQERIGQNE
ncbi:phosphomevalonate kinase [Streptococcus massiliensis]|uniref:phosphomevalonate kinase n=1 Tax=Streptococcus massiliensis TaxID=313439 RepID=A0A380KZ56_9STRE|nr:phosphomevalonate kinase [Streptococcus massiliensis]SUN77274.1 phosphomevalonate kinase [Streptococcus massiliensis]